MPRKPAPSPTGLYVAQSSGVFKIAGKLQRYHVGEVFQVGHPLLEIRPGSFRPLTFGEQGPQPVAVAVAVAVEETVTETVTEEVTEEVLESEPEAAEEPDEKPADDPREFKALRTRRARG